MTATEKILAATKAFIGHNTRGLKGAPARDECVAAVQQILDNAGLSEIGHGTLGVAAFEAALPFSGYVKTNHPVPGDFVIIGDQDHVGVYLGNGMMVSNSSTPGKFVWEDTVTAQNASYAGNNTPCYWHHQ
jgi:cell wall-associated NlpC family hydrolase